MSKVLLMSANEIKNFTSINYNVSDDYISATIEDVQEVYLQEIIGTALLLKYKDLITKTSSNSEGGLFDESNNAYNEYYQNFIKNYLKEKVEVELLTNLNFKIRNAGIVKENKSISYDDLSRLIRNKETSVNHWATMLSKYLKDCDFVELNSCNNPSWYIAPKIGKDYGNIQLWLGGSND